MTAGTLLFSPELYQIRLGALRSELDYEPKREGKGKTASRWSRGKKSSKPANFATNRPFSLSRKGPAASSQKRGKGWEKLSPPDNVRKMDPDNMCISATLSGDECTHDRKRWRSIEGIDGKEKALGRVIHPGESASHPGGFKFSFSKPRPAGRRRNRMGVI